MAVAQVSPALCISTAGTLFSLYFMIFTARDAFVDLCMFFSFKFVVHYRVLEKRLRIVFVLNIDEFYQVELIVNIGATEYWFWNLQLIYAFMMFWC